MPDETREKLRQHYSRRYAGEQDRSVIANVESPRNRFEAAVKWAGSGQRALEIAAGDGQVLRSLLRRYDEWVATELSQPRVDSLEREYADDDQVQILAHDISEERLPFPDNHFDTALLIAVVEHLVDPVAPLVEIRRVLRPGGKLLIDTPNIAKWTRRVKLLCGWFPATASTAEGLVAYDGETPTAFFDEGHLHYFTFRSLSRLLIERAGYKRIDRKGYGPAGVLGRLLPTLFSDVLLIAEK